MTITERLRDNKALYAVAGAGDLAVEKLREVPEQVARLGEEVRENVNRYQGDFRENLNKWQDQVRQNVDRIGGVPVKDLPGTARSYMTQVGDRTVEVIDRLAERGKKVVTRVEEQPATQELEESAKRTQRRTKGAVGEARKTTRTASRATADASKKIGD